MKKLIVLLVGAFAVAATTPVFAGPNWEIIEQARKDAKDGNAIAKQKMKHQEMMKACQDLNHSK